MHYLTRLAGALACAAPALLTAQPVTTESLIREMTDMHALAAFPDPAFKTVQFSSFDRRSTLPGEPGWYSNADGFGNEPIPAFEAVLREPGEDGVGEYLICDIQSPGAVVRCWTAAINGRIRMELDGRAVFDGSADDFLRRPFDVLGAAVGVDPAVFNGSFNQQNASYCPMPFAERCRIVWTGDLKQVHFYEVQARVYEAGAEIETFAPDDLAASIETIRETSAALAAPGSRMPPAGGVELPIDATVGPGAAADLLVLGDGPGAIARLTLRVRAENLDLALRQTLLCISFDGAQDAQVQAPIGDFFGAGPGVNPFDSVPFTVEPDGTMTCRFVMPFARAATLRAVNLGGQPVAVAGSAARTPWDWTDRSMHFRARWRVDHGLVGDPQNPQDIPFLLARGRGRYVGSSSIMLNPTDVPTPGGGWWGEGDEKIFIDDDTAPSTYGTGSEDYYNYAWSIPDIFGFAYCGQPRNDGPGNRGFVTNHRWHIVDSLPFHDSIAFYMELWPHRVTPGYSYARVGYHYAAPGLIDDITRITPDDVRPLELPAWSARAEGGARNSTFLEAETALRSHAGVSAARGNLYSGGGAAIWRPSAAGDRLSFPFTVGEAAEYTVGYCAQLSGESGRVRLWLDDQDEGAAEIDLHAPARTILRRVELAAQRLEAGEHTLHAEFVGEPGRTIGIDFLWVQRR
ncbi:MAG: DUF2961 domain-containing protein [Phycisphaerales bacterium]|nr:DUF2961 domain-containing protein [Phycisphaerales bacterium]